jgi:hypothetical protein
LLFSPTFTQAANFLFVSRTTFSNHSFSTTHRNREFPCCRANILEKGRGFPRKLFEDGAMTSVLNTKRLRQPSCFRGPTLFRNVGNPRGARDSGRLSLLTFFGEAKKVSCRRATPGSVAKLPLYNHIRRGSRCSARPTIRAVLKSKPQHPRALQSKNASKSPPILGLRY